MQQVTLSIDTNDFFVQEAFKTLRTNISFCGEDTHTIAVTSSFPHEGKSEVALRLAYAFAETGAKTILLDADIRNSVLAGRLNNSGQTIGLTHILAGKEKTLSSAICSTDVKSLDIMFAGPPAPNPAELLDSANFRNLLQTLRNNYEYVIIDCPPVLPVIDASIISKLCDGTLFVIAKNEVRKSDAKKAVDQLKISGVRILGAVLNKADAIAAGYGYGYGYEHAPSK